MSTSPQRDRLDGIAIASLLLCCMLWGLNQVAAKATLASVPPLIQAAARSLGAASLVALWAGARGVPWWPRDRATALAALGVGGLFAAEFGCIFVGLQHTNASRMVVFIYLSPFVVALGMPWISAAEKLDAWQWSGLVAAFAGVAWAFSEGFGRSAGDPRQWLGDSLGVCAGVLWGLTTLTIRATRLAFAPAEATLQYQLVVSGVALALSAGFAGEPLPASIPASAALWLGFQIVVVSFASYLLWFWIVRHYPPTRVSAFTLLTPLFGLIAGAALLGEPVTPRLATATLAVAAGIAMVNRLIRRPSTAAASATAAAGSD